MVILRNSVQEHKDQRLVNEYVATVPRLPEVHDLTVSYEGESDRWSISLSTSPEPLRSADKR